MDYTDEQTADIEKRTAAAVASAEAAATVKAAKEAEDRTRAAMLAEIGGDPKAAAAALKAAQKAEAEAQTEIQKATAALAASELRATAAETASAGLLRQALVTDALIAAGIDPKAAKAMGPSVIVPDGADEAVVAAAVEVLKAAVPALFASESALDVDAALQQPRPVDSHPPAPKPPAGETKLSQGAALFASTNPHLVNSK